MPLTGTASTIGLLTTPSISPRPSTCRDCNGTICSKSKWIIGSNVLRKARSPNDINVVFLFALFNSNLPLTS